MTNCKAYYKIESLHDVKHLNEDPKFTPKDGVAVQILFEKTGSEGKMVGNKFIPAETSYEYDLFECPSFKEDKGAWQRARPGEAVPT